MTSAVVQVLGGDTPRVWSFIVTIFGDLARDSDRYISSRTINCLTAEIGVKPEATRVALHRLRKEDWLESVKIGRESHFRLTNKGRTLSREAAPRIYGSAAQGSIWLSLYDPTSPAPTGLRILSGVSLVDECSSDAMNIAVSQPLPQWMVDRLLNTDVQRAAMDLRHRLSGLVVGSDLSAQERCVLRLCIVHEWRRVILRIPDVPDHVFHSSFGVQDLRQSVHRLLSDLSDVSLDQLVDV